MRSSTILLAATALLLTACPEVIIEPGPIDSGSEIDGGEQPGDAGQGDAGHDAGTPDAGETEDPTTVLFYGRLAPDGGTASHSTNNIWSVQSDGTELSPVTQNVAANSFYPFLNRNGDRVVYLSNQLTDDPSVDAIGLPFNVWSVNVNGSDRKALTTFTGLVNTTYAQWTDTDRIVFGGRIALDGSNAGGPANLWIMDKDGANRTVLTGLDGPEVSLWDFSVHGDAVFYGSDRGLTDANDVGVMNIWRTSLDGSEHVALTQKINVSSQKPAVSPDGTLVAFLSDQDLLSPMDVAQPGQNIWVMNAEDGSNPLPLTNFANIDITSELAWVNGGANLVFSARTDPEGSHNSYPFENLFQINLATGSITVLASSTTADSYFPLASIDGEHVIFESNRFVDGSSGKAEVSNLWIVRMNDTGLKALTTSETASSFTANNDF